MREVGGHCCRGQGLGKSEDRAELPPRCSGREGFTKWEVLEQKLVVGGLGVMRRGGDVWIREPQCKALQVTARLRNSGNKNMDGAWAGDGRPEGTVGHGGQMCNAPQRSRFLLHVMGFHCFMWVLLREHI